MHGHLRPVGADPAGRRARRTLANAMFHGNLELSSLRGKRMPTASSARRGPPAAWPYPDRRIELEVRLARDLAVFIVRDEGRGFDPAPLPDPTDPANLEKVTGRGILLMRAFMDGVEFNPGATRSRW